MTAIGTIARNTLACIAAASLLPVLGGCSKSPESMRRKLEGTWTHETEVGTGVKIEFLRNGGYYLYKTDVLHAFAGSYEVTDDLIRLVDIYCGTKMPGIYRFDLSGSGDRAQLTLELIDDGRCTRGDFMPGVWKKTADAPAAEASAARTMR